MPTASSRVRASMQYARILGMVVAPAILVIAACGGENPSSSGSEGSGAGPTGGGNTGGMGGNSALSDCPQADAMLDVSNSPGAGANYPAPTLSAVCTETSFIVDSNGIPTYTFVATTPNPLLSQNMHYEIPKNPAIAAATTALPLLGTIGFAVNGLPIFGPNEGAMPLDSAYGDPVYNGLMDACMGHTANVYHYHALLVKCLIQSAAQIDKPWMNPNPSANEASPIVGFALDGFAIYGNQECADAGCTKINVLQSGYEQIADPKKDAWKAYQWKDHAGDALFLDECNGHTGPKGDYHYHATSTFPYVLGCFKGTPDPNSIGMDPGGMQGGPKSCTQASECNGACPPGSVGCTCAPSPMGMICAPTCTQSGDCPAGPMGMQMMCNNGICTP